MNIPPPTEPTSLCVGSSKNLCAGWLCVFEGTEDECKQYFQDNKVPDKYDHVFMMNCYRETVLRTFLDTNNTGGTH
jgi:hypothetical protein